MILFFIFFILPIPLLLWLLFRYKNRKTKWILGTVILIFLTIYGFTILGLWSMEIEDKYQGHENVYFDSSKGDTIILTNSKTNQFISKGQIQRKTWNKVYIKSETDTLELFDWIEQNGGKITEVKCDLKK